MSVTLKNFKPSKMRFGVGSHVYFSSCGWPTKGYRVDWSKPKEDPGNWVEWPYKGPPFSTRKEMRKVDSKLHKESVLGVVVQITKEPTSLRDKCYTQYRIVLEKDARIEDVEWGDLDPAEVVCDDGSMLVEDWQLMPAFFALGFSKRKNKETDK